MLQAQRSHWQISVVRLLEQSDLRGNRTLNYAAESTYRGIIWTRGKGISTWVVPVHEWKKEAEHITLFGWDQASKTEAMHGSASQVCPLPQTHWPDAVDVWIVGFEWLDALTRPHVPHHGFLVTSLSRQKKLTTVVQIVTCTPRVSNTCVQNQLHSQGSERHSSKEN